MNQLLLNTRVALYVDERILKELATDTNADGVIDTSPIITAALKRSSEEVASAATRSNAYTVDDLENLSIDTNALLEGLVSDLALCFLFERRGGDVPEAVKAKAIRAQTFLGDLRDGKRVFDNDIARAAGTPAVAVIAVQARGNLGMTADCSFFPIRKNQAY